MPSNVWIYDLKSIVRMLIYNQYIGFMDNIELYHSE